jgi:hypothetical protein
VRAQVYALLHLLAHTLLLALAQRCAAALGVRRTVALGGMLVLAGASCLVGGWEVVAISSCSSTNLTLVVVVAVVVGRFGTTPAEGA